MGTSQEVSMGEVRPGLEGVVAFQTELSDVDGERGRLVVRGHDVESLARRASFEDAVGLLLDGTLPDDAHRESIRQALAAGRQAAFDQLPTLGRALAREDGMDALRAALAQVASSSDRDDVWAVLGAAPVFVAAWWARRDGRDPIAPSKDLGHAADYLRMLRGTSPDAAEIRALDAYLVTVADHGMNASTFTARVVTSTGSDFVSAAVAAVGALKGPLHGGAPGPVLDMLDAIGAPERAEAWLAAQLTAGRRIMGMGHRIYRVRDPRAAVLEHALGVLEASAGREASHRLPLARGVERAAEGALAKRYPDRPLRANVEFYTAVLLDAVHIPRAAFAPTFAVGRSAGWMAHALEERRTGRLVRPASRYVGAPVRTT